MSGFDVIVLGSDPNGLAAASSLARKKKRVLILETAAFAGGLAAGRQITAGFRTRGILQDSSKVAPELLKRLGLKGRSPVPVLGLEQDGRGLLLERDPSAARDEISAHEAADVAGYESWRSWVDRVAQPLGQLMERAPFEIGVEAPLWPLLRAGVGVRRLGKEDMMELLRRAPGSAQDLVQEFVSSPLLQAMLIAPGLRGAWLGPRSPSSAANLLLHESKVGQELAGGPNMLVEALLADCKRLGVEVRLGQALGRLVVEAGRVRGVECGGQVLSCQSVLSALGPRQTLLERIEPRALPGKLAREVSNIRCRGSLASVAFALKSRPVFSCRPELDVEKAIWAPNPTVLEKSWDDVKHRRLPSNPPLDIRVHQDEGGWVLHALVRSAPFELDLGWSPARHGELGDIVQNKVSELTDDFEDLIVARDVLTPVVLARDYGLDGGHELQAELALDQLHAFRPSPSLSSYATPIEGLWLGSAGSHPGGVVDGRAGLLAASALLSL